MTPTYPEALQATVKFANALDIPTPSCSNEFKPNANSIVNMIPRIRSLTFVSAIFTASFLFTADYPTAVFYHSAGRDWPRHVDRRHAYLVMGRIASRFHGRTHAACEFAYANFGT